MCITTSDVRECPQLLCTAKESDTRVWLHVVHSAGNKKLLFSPDTEVYHIGHLLEFQGGYVICDRIWRKKVYFYVRLNYKCVLYFVVCFRRIARSVM